jgi:hypothetical protein
VSARLRDPAIVSDLLFQAAELSRGREGHWTDLTSELASYAAQLRKHARAEVKPSQPYARLVFGPAHKSLVLEAKKQAQARIFVTSHRISTAARQAVLVPLAASTGELQAENPLDVTLYYGLEPEAKEPSRTAITSGLNMTAVDLIPQLDPSLHAKALGWDDDDVVITSQNWLSADPSDANMRREFGVHLHGPGVADVVHTKLLACFSTPQTGTGAT